MEDLQRQTSDQADTQDGTATSSSQSTVAAEEARPQTPVTVADAPSPQLSEQEQVVSATKWMVHALMAPATTDSFGHEMWGHVLGCCDGSAPCPSGLNCQNVKSTMRHLLQCQVGGGVGGRGSTMGPLLARAQQVGEGTERPRRWSKCVASSCVAAVCGCVQGYADRGRQG